MNKLTRHMITSGLLPVVILTLMGVLYPLGAVGAQPAKGIQAVPDNGIITQSGYYCLQSDLVVDRDFGVMIQADDVVLDLCGYALRYAGEPRPGVHGVVCSGRSDIRITNGSIGGFWFGVHCTQNRGLTIDRIQCDDIPYLAVNVAQSYDVVIRDCRFTNFRYDIPKEKDTYVIGINIGAEDAVISGNTFDAQYTAKDPNEVGMETVFVLFSARVSQGCVLTHNEMAANVVLPRSYGVWVASHAGVTASYNSIKNMKYGICLASEASAVISFNDITADGPPTGAEPIETLGVSAGAPKDVYVIKNRFDGLSIDALLPEGVTPIE